MNLNDTLMIGSVIIPGRVCLAPMAGVSDSPYRQLCREQGAALVCSEMVSAKGIYYNNKNTEQLLSIDESERPVSLQLFGSDPKIVSEMAKRIEELPFDILDINMGCPVPKVVKNGEGSAMLKNIPLAARVLAATVNSIKKPVTVKIRKGFQSGEEQGLELAHIAEESGVAAVIVHGRTREEYYHGRADWDFIRRVKESLSVPVFGNGDVFSLEDAEKMIEDTKCDGVMIGRAAKGNPWVFSGRKPTKNEIRDMILRHTRMEIDFLSSMSPEQQDYDRQFKNSPENRALRIMRTHIAWYTAGIPGGVTLRRQVNSLTTYKQLEELMEKF
ncbi:MAG: tRNA dihydrouridine synthase DusB [Eubacterium sp.]|nr:tRNA dihydrouridine synthase DusB [Eubacterium sp.]